MKKIIMYLIITMTITSTVNAAEVPSESAPCNAINEAIVIVESFIGDILTEVQNGLGYADARAKSNRIFFNAWLNGQTNGYSYGISKTPSAASILSAQQQAIEITSDCPYRRTFHSDRGWAYQMNAYFRNLKENRIFQSMSRKGNCYDNSVMENFFGILKQEMYYGTTYYSFDELKGAIERYIKYYNEKRIKEKLGWMSPVEYRLNALAA